MAGEITDSNIVWSSYNWRNTGTLMESGWPSAWFEFQWTGTSLAVEYDVSDYSGADPTDWPLLDWIVDNAVNARASLYTGSDIGGNIYRKTIASGLAAGTHTIYGSNMPKSGADHWATMLTRIKQFVQSDGSALASTAAPSVIRTKRMITFGDSITVSGSSTTHTQFQWSHMVARALGYEWCALGINGMGWLSSNYAQFPAFHVVGDTSEQLWRWYSDGQSRLVSGRFSPVPDAILVNMGTNDSASVQAAVTDWLTQIRAACPGTTIMVMVPFGQFQATAITNAVNAARAGGDTRVYLIDLGAEMSIGLTNAGGSSFRSTDTIHPREQTQAECAARTLAAIYSLRIPNTGLRRAPVGL